MRYQLGIFVALNKKAPRRHESAGGYTGRNGITILRPTPLELLGLYISQLLLQRRNLAGTDTSITHGHLNTTECL